MIYMTGDTHGMMQRIYDFCERRKTSTKDVMVILGDVGFNYYLTGRDRKLKKKANKQPITWFCVKGNHEKYAGALPEYEEREAFGGVVYVEPEFPNILFAKDGEIYTFKEDGQEKKVLVIGGAYSVDCHYRVAMGMKWFSDEQPSTEVKKAVEEKLREQGQEIDYVFSHTCPKQFEPREWFLSFIDESKVDKTTEVWLDKIYNSLSLERWYCGHFHGAKLDGNVRFMFEDYVAFGQ